MARTVVLRLDWAEHLPLSLGSLIAHSRCSLLLILHELLFCPALVKGRPKG